MNSPPPSVFEMMDEDLLINDDQTTDHDSSDSDDSEYSLPFNPIDGFVNQTLINVNGHIIKAEGQDFFSGQNFHWFHRDTPADVVFNWTRNNNCSVVVKNYDGRGKWYIRPPRVNLDAILHTRTYHNRTTHRDRPITYIILN